MTFGEAIKALKSRRPHFPGGLERHENVATSLVTPHDGSDAEAFAYTFPSRQRVQNLTMS